MRLLIVGYGFVGTATEYLFDKKKAGVFIHDPEKGYHNIGGKYDYIFLCVPTDLDLCNNRLNTYTLKEAYDSWKHSGQIVIRSTIGPNQVKEFPDAIMMPEFLREKHWKEDVDNPNLPLIVSDEDFALKLVDMLSEDGLYPPKRVFYAPPEEAAMFKLARNSALAMKVAIANEFSEICESLNMDYTRIQLLLENDIAVGGSHWQVPGPDGCVGFGGKCLPKDLTHMEKLCYNTDNVFETALRNNKSRRPLE